jgi:SAM-dependent methyltransferase
MNLYDGIAGWYDLLQSSIDYDKWADFLHLIDQRHGTAQLRGDGTDGRRLLADLGCGTGRMAFAMERRGYDVIGIDHSEEMLQIARELAVEDSSQALFLKQDICDFELFGTIDLAVCLLDTVNHITDKRKLRNFFRLCANYLNQDALLIFDIGSKKHFSKTLGDNVFYQDLDKTETSPALTMLWQNEWDGRRGLSTSEITVFAETDMGLYERYDDLVQERFYDWATIRDLAYSVGLELVASYGELADRKPSAADERIFMVFVQPHPKQGYDQNIEKVVL